MATKPTLPSALKELEQQLTCPVCLDIYTNPKSLPCLHSFCQHCLEGLPVNPEGNKYYIKCPTCRTSTELPEPTGPAAFPVAFHINNFKEVYSLMKKVTETQQVTCDVCTVANANGYCKDCNQFLCQNCYDTHKKFGAFTNHQLTSLDEVVSASQSIHGKQEKTMNCSKHDDQLRIFCETCQEVICRDCTIGDHKIHDCTPIKDSYDKHRQGLETGLNPVKKLMDNIVNVLTALTKRENEVKEQGDMVKQEIHVMVEKMIGKLRQSERQLTREVETATDSKLQVLSGQKKSAEMSLSRLKDCKEFVEQSLKTGSQQQVLMSKKQMMERMSHVTKEINVEEYNPIEKADIQLIKNNKMELSIGNIVYTTALQQYKVMKIDHRQITCEKERVSFPLSLELPNSSLLTVPLSSLCCSVVSIDNTHINTTVTTTEHPGVYRIHCSPVMNGPHQVNVQVNNVQLESTSLVIPFNPYLAKHTSIRTTDGLKPFGVAVSDDGHAIVTEWNVNCITVLDREGKKVKSFTSSRNIKFSSPRGVAITPDNFILVTDEHKIQKLTMNGKLIASVGQQGSKPLEFNEPRGITISPTSGHIYVVDCNNHRIQVLNPDLTFSYSFGSKGSAEVQFCSPWFIAIDNQGLVYVSDCWNHRIQVFTSEGKYIFQFGTYGSGPGQLLYPTGLVINNNLLYVAERNNHRVSIFTTDGQFVSSFGGYGNKKDQFTNPLGITLDNEGYLYICDYWNNRLVMY